MELKGCGGGLMSDWCGMETAEPTSPHFCSRCSLAECSQESPRALDRVQPPPKNPENLPGGRSEWLFTVVTHYTASGSLLSCFLAEGRNSEKIRDAFFVRKPQISKVILDKGVSLEVKTTTTLTEQARRIVSGFLNAV